MSKASTLITRARLRLKDPGEKTYSRYEMLDYLNDAVDFVSMELIAQQDLDMIYEINHTSGEALPDNFVAFAGQHPVYTKNGLTYATDTAATSTTIRYFGKKDRVEDVEANSPFLSMYDPVLVQLMVIFAMNRDTGGIPADAEILNQIRQNIGVIKQQQQKAQG
ncbi:hypothetical protein [Sporomusa termitida]|uniref:Uncharacterized protein n=1 Tax=Sporomusa termitida TaxID=2377 RepID=A0A517DS91_9FIRM|nr:hypothetical protein [Sporomusa termitida]QDR80230.1 hypothetical protein SPTER_15490 [Sporomusa termitida]